MNTRDKALEEAAKTCEDLAGRSDDKAIECHDHRDYEGEDDQRAKAQAYRNAALNIRFMKGAKAQAGAASAQAT